MLGVSGMIKKKLSVDVIHCLSMWLVSCHMQASHIQSRSELRLCTWLL